MQKNHADLAFEYYTQVSGKKADEIKKYLHPEVEFSSPLMTLKGRDAVVEATRNFMKAFATLKIRTKLQSDDQAMIVYDSAISGISKSFPGASLLSFRDGLIVKIELFFDASGFHKK